MTAAAAKKTWNKLEFPEPSEKQWAFIRCNKRYVAYGGARGGGKSHIARWYAVLLALKFAGIKILIMRKTYPELTKNHIRPLMKILRSKNPDKKQRIGDFKRNEDTVVFGVVPIGGAIVRPRCWRLQPTKGNGCASPRRAPPTKGPRRSNLVYSITAYAHRGLALLGVDLHEVGDLLALTNSLVQLHIMSEAPK